MHSRVLDLAAKLKTKSHFLLGPRATGKSSLIRANLPDAQVFDLLDLETYDRFLKSPHLLEAEIRCDLVVIDEVQKLPRLLDTVHKLIESKKIRFLLTGSSARKLKRGGTNLLAGRARSLQLFPLIKDEIKNFDLLHYCNTGGIPMIHDSDNPWLDLREYVQLYIKEEIIAEAAVRRIDHYARFLDIVGQRSGEELNFQQIANDSGVPVRTVDNFIEVLQDTLLAFQLLPYKKTKKRKCVSKSKLFLFDVGVANYLSGRKQFEAKSSAFGTAFEHFIIQELRSYLGYSQIDLPIQYWRTTVGNNEVDCIIGDEIAIEIKSSERFNESMLSGLKALKEEKLVKKLCLVSRDPVERTVGGVDIIPYEKFLALLWGGELLK